jgi:hypothetical protein
MATNLLAAVTSTSPISVSDMLGTFKALIAPDSFALVEISPREFRAFVTFREV